MKHRTAALALAFLMLLICCCACGNGTEAEQAEACRVDYDNSYFSDFQIADGQVEFYCRLCIVNESDDTRSVKIMGDFEDDVSADLVCERYIYASLQGDKTAEVFTLAPGENFFDVSFAGEQGDSTQKTDRLLPPITIYDEEA